MKTVFYLIAVLACSGPALAFDISGHKWPGAQVDFYVDIPGSSMTGILWNTAFTGAMQDWSTATDFNFVVKNEYLGPCVSDGLNGVDFTADVCGQAYGANTVAVTLLQFDSVLLGPPRITESDVVVNQSMGLDVFDGPLLQFGMSFNGLDFRRIALHELGHVMGLDHETTQQAIMAPSIGNLDHITEDDIAGVNTLYGGLANCTVQDLKLGTSSAALNDEDCTVAELTVGGGDTSFIDVYHFEVQNTTLLNVTMTSPTLDAVLLIADSDLQFIGYDDKTSGECGSSLSQTLPAGSYFLLANTYDIPPKAECGNTGEYSLEVELLSNQFQLLGDTASLLGGNSAAQFSGGITADDGVSYGNQFKPDDSIDIAFRINIDPQHQGQAGFLVVAAVVNSKVLFLNEAGNFVAFSLGSGDIPKAAIKTLDPVEELEIFSDLVPSQLGIDNITVDFVVGYGLAINPQEVYFHRDPLQLVIAP